MPYTHQRAIPSWKERGGKRVNQREGAVWSEGISREAIAAFPPTEVESSAPSVTQPNILLFIEGVVSISLQLLVIRQLVPFVGSSINVTSIVVTVFLAALAVGYWMGGRCAQPGSRVVTILMWLGLSLPLLFSQPFIGVFFSFGQALGFSGLVITALYCLLCLAPVVYLFGQFVVLLVPFRRGEGAAAKAGETFYISTIGNVVGGLVTTLVVMYYFGVAVALALMTGLVCVGVLLVARIRIQSVSVVCMAMGLSCFAVVHEQGSFLRTTAHANYYVAPTQDSRLLVVNGQNASRSDPDGVGHGYIEWMEERIEAGLVANVRAQVLVLGAGGFTLGQGRSMDVDWQFVDVDAHLPDIASEFLHHQIVELTFYTEDARGWLTRSDQRFDVVVLDVFSHRTSVPDHLLTHQFFELVRHRLKPNGRLLMNVILTDGPSRLARGIENTLRFVFSMCEMTRLESAKTPFHNRLIECTRSPLDAYRVVYSDHNTKALLDGAVQ